MTTRRKKVKIKNETTNSINKKRMREKKRTSPWLDPSHIGSSLGVLQIPPFFHCII
ncbi:MAG TPA: hypothetical protein VIP70_02165 [Nitrososphaeraceae archaeon]